jgi:hypothetical protein
MMHPDWDSMSLQQELNFRNKRLRELGAEPSARSVAAVAHIGRTGTARKPLVRARAPRAAGAHIRGSRRTSSSSRTSGSDPGDPDPEPSSPRVCGGCGEPLIGKAPQARYHDDACRMRARRLAAKPHRPVWTEAEIIALALTIEPFPVIAGIMEEPPGGCMPPRRRVAREWATGPGRGHHAKITYGRLAVAA